MEQAALAELLNVHQTTVSGWEIGLATPRPRSIARLEAIFGVPIAELLAPETENGGPRPRNRR